MRGYVRVVEAVNYRIGRVMMWGIFVMMGILLYSSLSKTFLLPSMWTLEMAQFVMAAYYLLGGAYAVQLDSHVRMDVFYSHLTPRKRAVTDAITILFVIFYLAVLLMGAISSTMSQRNPFPLYKRLRDHPDHFAARV